MADGNEGPQLDPNLWQALPEDFLEKVITKLPFSKLVAFRAVCKRWYSHIIPNAAAHLEAATGGTAVLYFSYNSHEKDYRGSTDIPKYYAPEMEGFAWWVKICNAKTEWSDDSFEEFQHRSFPTPRTGEQVRLLGCEGGLLFFGFICKEMGLLRDIVVCNPLIPECKCLGLPRPLRAAVRLRDAYWRTMHSDLDRRVLVPLVGVVCDSKLRSYCLLSSGMDQTGKYATFLFHSGTSAWTNGPCLFAAFREVAESDAAINLCRSSDRSVCCNGNLYWKVTIEYRGVRQFSQSYECVLKYDIPHGTWSVSPDLFVNCNGMLAHTHCIVSYKEDILVWHLHRWPAFHDHRVPLQLVSCELYNLDNYDEVSPPQYIDWPCRSDHATELGTALAPEIKTEVLAPEIKVMPNFMMEKLYRFHSEVGVEDYGGNSLIDYLEVAAFSQQNFIYHVRFADEDLCVLIHNTSDNSCTESPLVRIERFPGSARGYRENKWSLCPRNVWSFSPSLTSVP